MLERRNEDLGILLQDRDLEVFLWLLDMKFAGIGDLNEVFFNAESNNYGGARSRIQKLEKLGFLKSTFGYDGTSKKYYLATKKAHRSATNSYPERCIPRPLSAINPAIFVHDLRVLRSRIKLESLNRAHNWKSERMIKFEGFWDQLKLKKEYMPDAIYENRREEPVAFELELSKKTKERYHKKVLTYASIIDNPRGLFKYCLFVVSSDFSFKTLSELTKPYGNKFRIQRYEDLVGEV